MSTRSYSKLWIHLIWGTYKREKLITSPELKDKLSDFLSSYSKDNNIFVKTLFVNSDHVHILLDLPTDKSIEECVKLLKGASSNYVNKEVNFKFNWSKGYAAFSVSESNIDKIITYINKQEEHHRKKSYLEEYTGFLEKHNLG
ncbi:MAG: transposase [Melioribacteraceae bacterium]|nr:MAG: transposase [Melioribacteraceae bacterium]